jgi:diguanylate cyclase (GGDEF)-like protein
MRADAGRHRSDPRHHVEAIAQLGASDPWRLVLWARYIGIPLLALLILIGPLSDDDRAPLVAVLLLVGLPVTLLLDRMRGRRPTATARLVELDAALAAVTLALEPAALPGIAVVMTADVAMIAAAAGRRLGERAIAASALALFAVAASTGAGGMYLIAVHGVTGLVLAIVIGNVADGERGLRRHHEVLLEGIEGIVWESTVGAPTTLSIGGHVEAILGVPAEELSPVDGWVQRIHASDQTRALHALAALVASSESAADLEYRVIAHGGRVVHVRDHVSVERDHLGTPVKVRGLVIDISSEREAERQLSHYRDIVEHIHTALIVVHLADPADPRSLILVAANPAASALLGRNVADHLGTRLTEAFPILRGGPIPGRLVDTIQVGVGFDSEMSLSLDPQSPVFAVHTFPLPGSSVAMALTDVTDRARVQARLRHQALHDALTGLPNRVLLNDRLRKGLSHARRENVPVAMMIMDLNHFKEINDTLGHHSGDVLLSVIAQRLRDTLREADTIARLGGDEFAILLTTDAHRSGAEAVARKIAELVEEPVEVDGVTIQVAASIGIAIFPEHAEEADGLARRADVAMYVAKRSGAPFAVYAPEDDRSSIRRLTLLGELRHAIAADQLVLHHQPTIDLGTGQVLRSEALLRWQHPQHGLMPPGEFMELAEMSGVIAPLTRWVLRQSIRQVKQLEGDASSLHVAVNVSARNLYEPDLVEWIESLLEEERFPGERLTLEITESLLMDDPLLAFDVLKRLKTFGISLSIDDFGTGYSSLSYLRDLPIDEIKIDQSFVAAMGGPEGDDTIVRSVIDLGHNLDLAVVAEGVEDVDTLLRLVELGCDRAQGFLLSQPMPISELGEVLRSDWFRRFALPLTELDTM